MAADSPKGDSGGLLARWHRWRRRLVLAMPRFVILACCLAAAWFIGRYVIEHRPDTPEEAARFVDAGNLRFAAGDVEGAAQQYRHALRFANTPEEREQVVSRVAAALESKEVASPREVYASLRAASSMWRHVMYLDPSLDLPSKKILSYHHRLAEAFDWAMFWELLYLRADAILKARPDDIGAVRGRAVALAHWQDQGARLSQAQLTTLSQDLQVLQAGSPDDAQIAFLRALTVVSKAEQVKDPVLARELREGADGLMTKFVERYPDSREGHLYQVVIRFRNALVAAGGFYMRDMIRELAVLDRYMNDDVSPTVGLEYARLLTAGDRRIISSEGGRYISSGLLRAERYLRHLVERHAASRELKLALGVNLMNQQKYAAAEEILTEVASDFPGTVDLSLIGSWAAYLKGHVALADLALMELQENKAEERRPRLLKSFHAHYDEVARQLPEAPHLERLKGKLAFYEGRHEEAASRLDSAGKRLGGRNTDALFYGSQALEKTGEYGAAAARLSRFVQAADPPAPQRVQAALDLARLLLRLRAPRQALRIVEQLRQLWPDNPDVVLLLSEATVVQHRLLGQQSKDTDALALEELETRLTELAASDQPGAARWLIEIYRLRGDEEKALAVARRFNARAPNDVEVLRVLLVLEKALGKLDDVPRQVADALATMPANPAHDLARQVAKTAPSAAGLIGELLAMAARSDAVQRDVALYDLLLRNQREEHATAALARMAVLYPRELAVLRRRLDAALTHGDLKSAELVLKTAEEAGMEAPRLAIWQAAANIERGNFDVAISGLKGALEQWPLVSHAHALLGAAYRREGKLREATVAYEQALRIKPDLASAQDELFGVYLDQGEGAKAMALLRQSLAYGQQGGGLISSYFDFIEGKVLDEQLLVKRIRYAKAQPQNHENRREIARLCLRMQRYGQAHEILTKLLEEDSRSRANVEMMAEFLRQTGEPDKAAGLLWKFAEQLGDQATCDDWLYLARFFLQAHDRQAALTAFERARKVENPNTLPASAELADWYYQDHELEKAIPLYQRVVRKTRHPTQWSRLVEALVDLERYKEADAELGELLKLAPEVARLYLLEGRIALALSDYDRAMEALNTYLKKRPTSAEGYLYRALCRQAGQAETALLRRHIEQDLAAAIQYSPDWIRPRVLLVEFYLGSVQQAKAIPHLQRLIEWLPTHVEYRHQLADVMLADEQFTSLLPFLRESAKLYPKDPKWLHTQASMAAMQEDRAGVARAYLGLFEMSPCLQYLRAYVDVLQEMHRDDVALATLQRYAELTAASPAMRAREASLLIAGKSPAVGRQRMLEALAAAEASGKEISETADEFLAVYADSAAALEAVNKGLSAGSLQSYLRARVLIRDQEFNEAAELLQALRKQMVPSDPLYLEVTRYLADTWTQLKRFRDARPLYVTLVEKEPKNPVYLNNYAMLMAEAGDRGADVVAYVKRALASAESNDRYRAALLETLGYALVKANMPRQAVVSYRESIYLDDRPGVHLRLGELLLDLDQLTPALNEVAAARAVFGDQPPAELVERCDALEQTIIQKADQTGTIRLRNARLLFRELRRLARKPDTALRAIKLARECLPLCRDDDDLAADVLQAMGFAELQANYPGNAASTLQKALKLKDLAQTRIYLTMALVRQHRIREANAQIQVARRMCEEAEDAELLRQVAAVQRDLAEAAARITQ